MTSSFAHTTKLTSADSLTGDRYGVSVAVSGNTVMSGAYWHDGNGDDSGAAYVYQEQGDGSWIPFKLTAADTEAGDNFGRWLAIEDDIAIVGAPEDDHAGGSDSGSAYIFQRQPDGSWTEFAKLTASDAGRLDEFGYGVDIYGDTIVIGAYRDDDNGRDSGAAYIFEQQSDDSWAQTAKLTASDGDAKDFFGHDVEIYGDTVVVGADDDEGGGSAYVFQQQAGGAWAEVAKLTADDSADGDRFGHAVTVDGDTIVVGAYLNDDTGADTGAAYVFAAQPDGSWAQTTKLTAEDAFNGDRFGRGVSLEGDTVLIGSYLDDSSAGTAYLFQQQPDGSWQQQQKLSADDGADSDNFGRAVALEGGTVVAGAYGDDSETGSIYIFSDNSEPAPGAIAFDSGSYTVAENGSDATITLVRTGGSSGEVSVDVTVADGTASVTADYSDASQTVTFLDGETSKTITVPIIDDGEEEGDETVSLGLSNPTGGAAVGPQGTATLTITDNDGVSPTPTPIRIEAENYLTTAQTVTEFSITDDSGIAIRANNGNVLTYEVSAPAAGTYSLVARVVAPKNGTYGFDAAIAGQTMNFSFGSTVGNWNSYIDIVIPDVVLSSGTQTLTLTMNANKFNINYLEFVPMGDPPPPMPGEIAFDSGSYTVAENGSDATITLVRTGGSSGEVSVDVTVADGTATVTADYSDVSQTVTFLDGETSKTITVPIIDDSEEEGDETVSLGLSNPTGGAAVGPQGTATLTITDNDAPDVLKIMPLGDSITHGWNTFPGGYRDRLENLLTDNNIAFDFVGTADDNGPASLSDKDHQGHPGWRIDEIAASVSPWLQAETPDVVQLLIGTNDVIQDHFLETAPDRLSALIDQILTELPDVHVVVATIPPAERSSLNNSVNDYNASISGIVDDKVAQGKSVSFVDMNSQMTVDDLGDRVHPNQTGYDKMAGVWFDGLLDILDDYGDYNAISDEFYVDAAVTASDDHSTTVSAELVNNTSASRSDLSFRYFVDITELLDAGYTENDVLIGDISGPTVGDLTLWDSTEDVYYVDVDFSGVAIASGDTASVEFSLGIAPSNPGSAWDATNDRNTQDLGDGLAKSRNLPLNDSSENLLSGVVPA